MGAARCAGIYPGVTYPRIVVLARGGTFEA
jgi:hypothetical protein